MRKLDQKMTVVVLEGQRFAVVDTDIPDDAPQALREGLARRAIVNRGGVCPCGARFVMPSRTLRRRAQREGLSVSVDVFHEPSCPAATDAIVASAHEWARGDR